MAIDAFVPCSCAARGLACTHEEGLAAAERIGSGSIELRDMLEAHGAPVAASTIMSVAPVATCLVALRELETLQRAEPDLWGDWCPQVFWLEKLFRMAIEHGTCVEWSY